MHLFLSFPYVCPEPVLAKCSFLYINGSKMPFFAEIDTPGHSASWAAGYPDAVASCPLQTPGTAALDPSSNVTFTVVRGLLEEMGKLAPDR